MAPNYFVIDIETCPINLENHENLNEDQKNKLINPIDSKIIAIGIRYDKKNIILLDEDEKNILEEFWLEWKTITKGSDQIRAVGFSITNFDIPFIISRSFTNNVIIAPFLLKNIIDLRDKINAYRYGLTRGTLKEHSLSLGIKDFGLNGSDIARLCLKKDYEKIKEYLANDLLITDTMFERVRDTNIININRW